MNTQQLSVNKVETPVFHVQHLATFTVGYKYGLLKAEDGMRKLRILEKSQGIWPMDCELVIDAGNLILIEKKSNVSTQITFHFLKKIQ